MATVLQVRGDDGDWHDVPTTEVHLQPGWSPSRDMMAAGAQLSGWFIDGIQRVERMTADRMAAERGVDASQSILRPQRGESGEGEARDHAPEVIIVPMCPMTNGNRTLGIEPHHPDVIPHPSYARGTGHWLCRVCMATITDPS